MMASDHKYDPLLPLAFNNESNQRTDSDFWVEPYNIPQSMFAENRMRLSQKFQTNDVPDRSLLFFEGGKSLTRHETDTELLFRQESTFKYLFGAKEPDFYATIEAKTAITTLFIPRLPESYAIWMGTIHSPEYFKDLYKVDDVKYVDELASFFAAYQPETIYVTRGLNSDSGNYAKEAHFDGIENYSVNNEKLFKEVVECRVIKTQEEIKLLQHVNDLSSDAHLAVMRRVQVGMMEFQLESIFQHWIYFRGQCRHCAYTSICGCGPNSSVLHYGHAGAPNDRRIQSGDMLLLDMGGEYQCYISDITCSFPSNGQFTEDQRLIFECVQSMQFAVLDELGPGVFYHDMHDLAYRVLCTKLKAGGLLKGEVEDMMAANIGSIFMPHGLGHFIGLDTHDVGGYPEGVERDPRPGYRSLRCKRVMQPNMVLTVEPGVYFIDFLLDKALTDPLTSQFLVPEVVNRFRGFGGVRLEDNVIITETGCFNMTRCPRTVEDVVNTMSGKITNKSQLFHHSGNSKFNKSS